MSKSRKLSSVDTCDGDRDIYLKGFRTRDTPCSVDSPNEEKLCGSSTVVTRPRECPPIV
ncbi:hypothetical protein Micbo1qcDRAFT_168767 [Microdochium bolleyi]|uniref:Uncharacterized protein n=1 Tax=Microdochium bolleyi TaxID=196109 RepID=A0A136IMH6_9PEZI|nr:hypothetical protein Micbo1qcDRAFT_168767 [Microdochium bolleyi]